MHQASGFPWVRAEEDPALAGKVTIVTSVKDQFGWGLEQFRRLAAAAPRVPILAVLSGPVRPATEGAFREEADRNPDLSLIDSGIDFGNPFELRNLAIPRVKTEYAMFLFNDVFPASPYWLSDLVKCADGHPEADLFQPFIWEGDGIPHAAWKNLFFVEDGGRVHVCHPYDRARPAVRDPSILPWSEQPFFLEDHAFLARTKFMSGQSILDSGCAHAKEYLDLALSARFQDSAIWSVPSAQVSYELPSHLAPEDLPYFTYRRSEEACAGSERHLRRKWGIEHHYDGIGRTFMNKHLAGAAWSGTELPQDPFHQWEMALSLFCAVGYNRFAIRSDPAGGQGAGAAEGFDLPALHRRLRENSIRDRGALLGMGRKMEPKRFPDFTPDYEQRREALRSGRLFPVLQSDASELASKGEGLFFEPFLMIELSGIRGEQEHVLRRFGSHSSLILRDAGGQSFAAWMHARYLPQERAAVGRWSGLIEACVRRGESPTFDGVPLGDVQVRVHRSDEDIAVDTPLRLGLSAEGWRLIHWAWNRHDLDQLASLFGVRA